MGVALLQRYSLLLVQEFQQVLAVGRILRVRRKNRPVTRTRERGRQEIADFRRRSVCHHDDPVTVESYPYSLQRSSILLERIAKT